MPSKIDDLVKSGMPAEDIAITLGRHPVAVRRLLPKGYKPKPRSVIPCGLTPSTQALRAKLGGIIAQMSEKGLTREEIGSLTGLNRRQSYAAERRPFHFDWTLSQIERTLAWYDPTGRTRITFLEVHAEIKA